MAFLAATPALLGGMSVGGALALGGTVAAGLMSAKAASDAGKAQQYELQAQARTEATAAKGREVERRRDLIRALSSQNAAAGVGGVELGGSIGGMIRRDIRDASNDLLTEGSNLASRQAAMRARGQNAVREGNTRAIGSLLDTAGSAFSLATPKVK